jgi:hypothetical protein
MKRLMIPMFVLLSTQVNAADMASKNCRVGAVAQLTGTVEVVRNKETITPTQGMKICRGDLFKTAAGSVAELALRDGTKLTVGKDTQLVIREYRIFRSKPNLALFDLVQGAFRSITGSITKRPHRFEVTTRVATIGVRGTDFWGGYGLTPDGAYDVIMLSGKGVYVKNDKGQVELNQAGFGTTVTVDGMPTEAHAWPAEKVTRAVATITP